MKTSFIKLQLENQIFNFLNIFIDFWKLKFGRLVDTSEEYTLICMENKQIQSWGLSCIYEWFSFVFT